MKTRKDWGMPAIVVGTMIIFSIARFTREGEIMTLLGASAIAYFAMIFMYYGVARLAFERHTYLLWGGSLAAIIVGYLASGLTAVWSLITIWGMILFASVVTGRLVALGRSTGRVFLFGVLTIIVFSIMQHFAAWEITASAGDAELSIFIEDSRDELLALGYSEAVVRENMDVLRVVGHWLLRLLPVLTVLGDMVPYCLGFILFVRWLGLIRKSTVRLRPLDQWQLPFWLTPLLIGFILMRLLGGEPATLVADNFLVGMAVLYSITGLALMEFYMRKYRVKGLIKVGIYIVLVLSQFIGFGVAAFLGFVDSFFDWRHLRSAKVT